MDDLIAQFLFQYSKCPLPGVGTLFLTYDKAKLNPADQSIAAPAITIGFNAESGNAAPLIQFISGMQHSDIGLAEKRLKDYCRQISSLMDQQEWVIAGAGRFLADAEGGISFESETLPDHFMPSVPARRVIRNDAPHSITVGDKETDNLMMAELLKDKSVGFKLKKGELAVLVIILISILLIGYRLTSHGSGSVFGNGSAVKIKNEPAHYLQK